jgi:hypothetical protein
MRPRRIFLSHSSADRKAADQLARALRDAGLDVWYSKSHLKAAQQWQDEIGRALRRCNWFLILLSPSAVKSMWVLRELSYALGKKRYHRQIIPVLLKPCAYEKLSWTLGTIQMVQGTGRIEPVEAELLALLKPRRQPPRRK